MKRVLIASMILLTGCAEPRATDASVKELTKAVEATAGRSAQYTDCMDGGADSAVTMRYLVANNIEFAKEIREDAKECLMGKSSRNSDVVEECSRYAHEINGGIYPGVKVWEYGFSYSSIYPEALECEKFK